jgi:hypothetical protein
MHLQVYADGDDVSLAQRELRLAREVAGSLLAEYPNHLWAVQVHGGAVIVKNLALHGRWGFVLHCHKIVDGDIRRAAMRAGGELLERWRVSRGAGGASQALDVLSGRDVLDRLPEDAL